MAAVTSPVSPGGRWIACRNVALAGERARKREDLLKTTERDLAKFGAAIKREIKLPRGAAEIGIAVGSVLDKHKKVLRFVT